MTDGAAAPARQPLPPQVEAVDILFGYHRSRALTVAAELGLADHLAHGAMHVDDLASRAGTHAPSLFRLMRALNSIGVFSQVSPRVFANTPLSETLRKDAPGSIWAMIAAGGTIGSGEFEAMLGLLDNVRTGKTAFDEMYGCNYWESLKRDPARRAIFNAGISATHGPTTPVVTAAYDWGRFPVIADIGGGIGSQLVDILSAYPACRGILFDLPEGMKDAIPHDRIECVSGSFLERVPQGADAYILRSIVHDWADAEAVAILKTVRAATKPEARVILIENVISDGPESDIAKWVDLHMMVLVGGKERTAAEHRALLAEAGFEIERIVPTPAGISLIVGRPSV